MAVGIHPIEYPDVAVLHQHGRGGNPAQSFDGNPGEHDPQAQGVEDLAQVDQVELGLPLQDSLHLVHQGIAVDGDAEVVGEGAADSDRDIPGAGGPAEGQVVAAALRPGGLGFGGEAVFPFAQQLRFDEKGWALEARRLLLLWGGLAVLCGRASPTNVEIGVVLPVGGILETDQPQPRCVGRQGIQGAFDPRVGQGQAAAGVPGVATRQAQGRFRAGDQAAYPRLFADPRPLLQHGQPLGIALK